MSPKKPWTTYRSKPLLYGKYTGPMISMVPLRIAMILLSPELRSGDDDILRRMDRGYTNERYRCG